MNADGTDKRKEGTAENGRITTLKFSLQLTLRSVFLIGSNLCSSVANFSYSAQTKVYRTLLLPRRRFSPVGWLQLTLPENWSNGFPRL